MLSALAGVMLMASTAAYASFFDPSPEVFCAEHDGVQSVKGAPNSGLEGEKYEVKCNDGSEYKNNGKGKIEIKEVS
jgi:hypothetical protein